MQQRQPITNQCGVHVARLTIQYVCLVGLTIPYFCLDGLTILCSKACCETGRRRVRSKSVSRHSLRCHAASRARVFHYSYTCPAFPYSYTCPAFPYSYTCPVLPLAPTPKGPGPDPSIWVIRPLMTHLPAVGYWCLLFVLNRHGLRGRSGPQRLIRALLYAILSFLLLFFSFLLAYCNVWYGIVFLSAGPNGSGHTC